MMCQEKVTACASLYSKGVACKINESTGKIDNAQDCGVATLLAFVDTVDDVKVEMGCKAALQQFAEKTCTPPNISASVGATANALPANTMDAQGGIDLTKIDPRNFGYPWGCRGIPAKLSSNESESFYGMLKNQAKTYCFDPDKKTATDDGLDASALAALEDVFNDVVAKMRGQMGTLCESYLARNAAGGEGTWDDTGYTAAAMATGTDKVIEVQPDFLSDVFGNDLTKAQRGVKHKLIAQGNSTNTTADTNSGDNDFPISWGLCAKQSLSNYCKIADEQTGFVGAAKIDVHPQTGMPTCVFDEAWYRSRCVEGLAGAWEDGECFTRP